MSMTHDERAAARVQRQLEREEGRHRRKQWEQQEQMTKRCTVILERLKSHFPDAPPSVRRARIISSQEPCNSYATRDGAVIINMDSDPAHYTQLTELMVLYHEFAHVLVGGCRAGNAHGPEFFAALLRVLKAEGRSTRWYRWHCEYGIVYEAALLAGYTCEPWSRDSYEQELWEIEDAAQVAACRRRISFIQAGLTVPVSVVAPKELTTLFRKFRATRDIAIRREGVRRSTS